MSITMVIEFKGKEGQGDAIIEWFYKNSELMTAADGLLSHRLYRNSKNPDTILSIEEWESEEAHAALVEKGRAEFEHWGDINSLLAEPLDGTYHHFISEHKWFRILYFWGLFPYHIKISSSYHF